MTASRPTPDSSGRSTCVSRRLSLTGESVPVAKDATDVLDPHTSLGDRSNMVFLGTAVAAGKADAVVVATGMATELGRIAGMLSRAEREPTPLQRRLAELGRVLIAVILGIVALIFVLRIVRGGDLLESFLLSVSLAVAAVPEGLPAVVTLVLAIGLQRLVRRNALIRKAAGRRDARLGDRHLLGQDRHADQERDDRPRGRRPAAPTTTSAAPATSHAAASTREAPKAAATMAKRSTRADWPDLIRAMQIAAWCNTAQVDAPCRGRRRLADHRRSDRRGPGRRRPQGRGRGAWTATIDVLHEIPFDSDRKAMSVLVRGPGDSATMYTKGAPEVILGKCNREWRHGRIEPLTPERRAEIWQRGRRDGRAGRCASWPWPTATTRTPITRRPGGRRT